MTTEPYKDVPPYTIVGGVLIRVLGVVPVAEKLSGKRSSAVPISHPSKEDRT